MTPNTTIKFLHNVPLDRSYKHTLYWDNPTLQFAYFRSMEKQLPDAPYDKYMYRRETDDIIVRGAIDDFYDVNYMMYQNSNYGDKWFYAFVTEARYENAHAVAIKFEIDIMQTWFFDHELKPSFVERWTPNFDVVGANTVPENLDMGDPVVMASVSTNETLFKTWNVVALSSFDFSTWQPFTGTTTGGVFSALKRTILGTIEITMSNNALSTRYIVDPRPLLNDLLTNHAALVDGLAAIFMAPQELEADVARSVTIPAPGAGDSLHPLSSIASPAYIPKNNKLYTAPFTRLFVTDGSGGGKFFDFEKFSKVNNNCVFRIFTDRAPAQSVVCVPTGYNGYNADSYPAGTDRLNFEESVIMTGFPQCAWISDSFKQYLAQNSSGLNWSMGLSAVKIGAGAGSMLASILGALPSGGITLAGLAGGAGLISSGIMEIGSKMADLQDRANRPPQVHGQVTGTAFFGIAEKAFRFITFCPRPEYLTIVDNYFSKFGYAQHKIFSPLKNARPHWTYIKTLDALVLAASSSAGINAEVLRRIEDVYNHGVTFWIDPDEVGDYTLDNSVPA